MPIYIQHASSEENTPPNQEKKLNDTLTSDLSW